MVTKFTIQRSKWFRGQAKLASYLRVDHAGPTNGHMCCLGFYSVACGLDSTQITGVAVTRHISSPTPTEMEWLRGRASIDPLHARRDFVEDRIAAVNDSVDIPESEREQQITEWFAKQGIEVVFED